VNTAAQSASSAYLIAEQEQRNMQRALHFFALPRPQLDLLVGKFGDERPPA
jgi:hypothetical protein